MNIPPSEADKLDLQTFQGILAEWNEMHSRDGDVDAPDPAFAIPLLDRINADPRLTH
jgi:hypothetical protein